MAYRAGIGKLRKLEDLRGVSESLFMMAVSSFEWDGLYEGLPSWLMERYLFDCGRVAAFEDPEYGFMLLPAWPVGPLDVQYNYKNYLVVGLGYQRQIDREDCILIYNNSAHTGSWLTVMNYSQAINEINLTDRLNIKQLRFPWIFGGDEETVNSLKAAITQVENNVFALYTNKSIQAELQKGIEGKTNIAYLGDDLKKHRDDLYNECLTLLGFDNIPISKKERLITDEANSNNQQIQFFRNDRLKSRQQAVEEINKRFGEKISVKWTGGDFRWSGQETGQNLR